MARKEQRFVVEKSKYGYDGRVSYSIVDSFTGYSVQMDQDRLGRKKYEYITSSKWLGWLQTRAAIRNEKIRLKKSHRIEQKRKKIL